MPRIGERMATSVPSDNPGGGWHRLLWRWAQEVKAYLETPPIWDEIIEATVQTSDATVTTCGTYDPPAGSSGFIESIVIGERATAGVTVAFVIRAAFDDAAGTPTLSAISVDALDSLAGTTDATFDVASGGIRVRVTGVAATPYFWRSRTTVMVR